MIGYVLIYLFGVFISAVSQVLLKKEAIKPHESIIKEYLNPRVIVAYILFFFASLLPIIAFRVLPLSFGPVLEATSYIYVMVFGAVIFHEKITAKKVLAIALIIGGIVLYSVGVSLG